MTPCPPTPLPDPARESQFCSAPLCRGLPSPPERLDTERRFRMVIRTAGHSRHLLCRAGDDKQLRASEGALPKRELSRKKGLKCPPERHPETQEQPVRR